MHPYEITYALPKSDCGVVAVVMSKWDDIVGPRSVRVWLQEVTEESAASSVVMAMGEVLRKNDVATPEVPSSTEVSRSDEITTELDIPLIEGTEFLGLHDQCGDSNMDYAIRYVTNHTVNCLSVTTDSQTSAGSYLLEKGTSFYAVPDVNLVFISLMFLVREGDTQVPYSFAILANYDNYQYFLRLQGLCLQWLRRIAFRFNTLLIKNSSNLDEKLWSKLNELICEFCNMFIEVTHTALGINYYTSGNAVKLKIMRRALTSHLQTFGSSVVIGETADDVNEVIKFLGLFLDENEKCSTCLIYPPRNYSYHMGVKLQGLLLDEYGGRDLASLELMSNSMPVTIIDLTIGESVGAVRQTANFHSYLASKQEMYRHEYKSLNEGNGSSNDHESVMNNVRDTSRLVDDAIRDLQMLPVQHWDIYIKMFLRRLNRLALSMLNLVSWMRSTENEGELINFPGESRGGVTLGQYLKDTLGLEHGDFLIILSIAERLKPGIYLYVTERNSR